MFKIYVRNQGCDDECAFSHEVEAEEYEVIERFVERANAMSTGGCQPTIELSTEPDERINYDLREPFSA
jgi:hypothetical protein